MPSFVETMRGEVRSPEGASHDISFSIRADGRAGHLALRGIVQAAPWATDAQAEGFLRIALLPPSVSYVVTFGDGLVLEGRKDVSLRRPVHSMTWMPVVLRDGRGEALAQGEMRFNLKDLPRFMASWWPFTQGQQRRLDAERRALARRDLARPA